MSRQVDVATHPMNNKVPVDVQVRTGDLYGVDAYDLGEIVMGNSIHQVSLRPHAKAKRRCTEPHGGPRREL